MDVGTGASTPALWPRRHDVLGVRVSATSYEELVSLLVAAASRKESACIDFMPVHGLITAVRDPAFQAVIERFDVVAPDGQPLRWALNWIHRTGLKDRVYGPELMRRVCAAAEAAGVSVYLYGSTPETLQQLRAKLDGMFPRLLIAGIEAPPFRPLTPEEEEAMIARINASGAGIMFIGLGCPRQEAFAARHREALRAVLLCVGAAFDFHAGTKRMAPAWMQRRGMEWLFRLTQEPRRLWRRYLVTNALFVFLLGRRLAFGR